MTDHHDESSSDRVLRSYASDPYGHPGHRRGTGFIDFIAYSLIGLFKLIGRGIRGVWRVLRRRSSRQPGSGHDPEDAPAASQGGV